MSSRWTVYLARHGETDWNRQNRWQGQTDIPLNEAGREQAWRLADRLRGLGIARIEASDLLRARETAAIVASALGIGELGTHAALRERCFGVFEGLTQEECAARYPEAWARYREDPRQAPPGAEPREEVLARVRAAVRALVMARPAGRGATLLVGHGGALRLLLGAEVGRPFPPIGNAAVFRAGMTAERLVDVEELPRETAADS
jgi:probable phosphoglycerate mutase